jgi:uncharacterized protein (TIGR02391 family)
MAIIPKDFETLCDREFDLSRREAYENIDREIAEIKAQCASTGNLWSSGMAQTVVDAILGRFDGVLLAFERAYLGKWSTTNREFSDADHAWLKAKVTEKLDPELVEVRSRANSAVYNKNSPGSFAGFWQSAETEARVRRNKIFDRIEILRLQKNQMPTPVSQVRVATPPAQALPAIWNIMHPTLVKIARPRFESGHFADSVEAALKEVNDIVRQIVIEQTGEELDGSDLMNRAMAPKKPILILDDPGTTTGRNIQVGYMQIFSGAMTGIRNPKAHANIQIDAPRAIHFLFLASLLLYKIDERKK